MGKLKVDIETQNTIIYEKNKEPINDNDNKDKEGPNEMIIENENDNIMKDKDKDKDKVGDNNISKNTINNQESISRISKKDISTPEKFTNLLKRALPKILDNYEIKECIGTGSESICFKVIYKKTQENYAMKLIINGNDKKRNLNELLISNKLKHRNIIKFYGIYEIKKNELDCMLMEYAKFGNLKDFRKKVIKRDFLSEQLLCFLAYQILNGIRHCHMSKVAHLDLKPQNVIVDEYLNIKLIDFSISIDYSKMKSGTVRLPFRGTNFYIAPEVFKSKVINIKDLNKVDLYSFGVILYNLAFCSYPFELNGRDSDDYDIIYDKIQNNELTFNNEDICYSKHFIDFLKKLLEKDINRRININQALNHYWIQAANVLNDEKEMIFNANSFLIYLMTGHFKSFDEYINKENIYK